MQENKEEDKECCGGSGMWRVGGGQCICACACACVRVYYSALSPTYVAMAAVFEEFCKANFFLFGGKGAAAAAVRNEQVAASPPGSTGK